jgi:nucleoside-diphosphate-sugar epimerase
MTDTNTGRPRVLVTGSEGLIGGILRERLADRFELTALTRDAAPFPSHIGDISDLDSILPAFEGVQSVVHLAASAAVGSSWEQVLKNNLIGAYNVFEAARRHGVERVVFASSNHAVGSYEDADAPQIYEPNNPRDVDEHADLRPDSLYGVSKVFGEALGRYYADHQGLRVIALRIGWVMENDDPDDLSDDDGEGLDPRTRRAQRRAMWLSHRDTAELVACALTADVRWALVYGVSDNPGRFWSLDHARDVLGFVPQDAAPAEEPEAAASAAGPTRT